MTSLTEDWANDADGDVFRRLLEHGFDFDEPHSVDYNVDFESWPPTQAALDLLGSMHGPITVYEPDELGDGYVQFEIRDFVSYEGVTNVQRRVSAAMGPYGGVCESWGVMQDAP